MSSHPNRGPDKVTPTPQQIRDARAAAGLSQRAAAALIHATTRAWQGYECDEGIPDHRRMHAGLWELFQRRLADGSRPLFDLPAYREVLQDAVLRLARARLSDPSITLEALVNANRLDVQPDAQFGTAMLLDGQPLCYLGSQMTTGPDGQVNFGYEFREAP